MLKVLAIANQKGGTGKTSLAVHLAAGLARQGHRTLLVDTDPQGSATTWLLGLDHPLTAGTAEALHQKRVAPEHVQAIPGREGLSLLPASGRLAVDEVVLSKRPLGELGLRNALRGAADRFDFVVIDCPPEAGFFVVSALFAADALIAPVSASFLSLAGLRRLEQLVAEVHEAEHPVRLLGFLMFAADVREGITAEAREILERERPGVLFKSVVRISAAAKVLPAHRGTAWDDGADERGRDDYGRVLREVLQRLTKKEG